MSTALVSGFYDFGDVLYKPTTTHFPLERKSLGSQLSSPPSRRMHHNVPPLSTAKPTTMQQKQPLGLTATVSVPPSSVTSREHRKLDRSMSEPVERALSAQQQQAQQQRPGGQANSSRYKTELCRPFEENGTCKYGDKCQFAHGAHELRTLARHPKYKTELCRTFHTTGFCPYGPRCHFIHNSEETKKSLLSNLQTGPHKSEPTPTASRPKALSIGSSSLGSAGDLSPPSSLSASPTSLNSFFDDPFTSFSPQMTPSTAFSFSQDFATVVKPQGGGGVHLPSFGGSQPSLSVYPQLTHGMGSPSNDFLADSVLRDPLFTFPGMDAPPSPVDSLSSELDSMSLGGGSPVPMGATQTTCGSPQLQGLPRLPIFSRLATNSDTD